MKKYGLLLMVVLVMSSTAWGGMARVMTPKCAPACEPVWAHVKACLPYECEEHCTTVCVRGNMIIVDMLYTCEDCSCGGATCVDKCVDLGDLCPGMYSVVVRIHCACGCCPRPRICALGSSFFRVVPCLPAP